MKDKEKLKILLKVIQRIYDKNPEMQEVIDASMMKVCAEESIYPEPVLFFILLFIFCRLYHNVIQEKNLN